MSVRQQRIRADEASETSDASDLEALAPTHGADRPPSVDLLCVASSLLSMHLAHLDRDEWHLLVISQTPTGTECVLCARVEVCDELTLAP